MYIYLLDYWVGGCGKRCVPPWISPEIPIYVDSNMGVFLTEGILW